MEKLIKEKQNNSLSNLECVERYLLKLNHFSTLNSQERKELKEANLAFQSFKNSFIKEPGLSMRELTDEINSTYMKDPNVDIISVRIELTPNPDLGKTSYVMFKLNNHNKKNNYEK